MRRECATAVALSRAQFAATNRSYIWRYHVVSLFYAISVSLAGPATTAARRYVLFSIVDRENFPCIRSRKARHVDVLLRYFFFISFCHSSVGKRRYWKASSYRARVRPRPPWSESNRLIRTASSRRRDKLFRKVFFFIFYTRARYE